MFWSHPNPCANSMGWVPLPETLTLLRFKTSSGMHVSPIGLSKNSSRGAPHLVNRAQLETNSPRRVLEPLLELRSKLGQLRAHGGKLRTQRLDRAFELVDARVATAPRCRRIRHVRVGLR